MNPKTHPHPMSLRAFFCEAISLTVLGIAAPIKLARNDEVKE
jgi:hypothetical protein